MKTFATTTLLCTSMALAAFSANAQDAMKKDPSMAKDPAATMSMQDCKDHKMAKKDGMKKDADAMKMDKACAEMMKQNDMSGKDKPSDPLKK